MSTNPVRDLLLDSEATLRLATHALESEIFAAQPNGTARQVTAADGASVNGLARPAAAAGSEAEYEPLGLAALPMLLLRVYREIDTMVERLRESRGALQKAAVDKLHHTNEKLQLVTSATEVAATDIMDSVDRALAMVDQLETRENADLSDDANAIRAALRDELFAVMTRLQFQDITTQQINHASAMLGEMESRLAALSQVFDPRALGFAVEEEAPMTAGTFDPQATTQNPDARQALADQLFQSP
jgi:chemotaxis regulatin CheY-phosphate phosphatase CheZ